MYVHSYLDVITVGESPASPTHYWSNEAQLTLEDREVLSRGGELLDKHITGCNRILQLQFPDMPSPQSCLLGQRPEQLKPAEENSVFFHHYNQHWAVSQIKDDTVYLYDSAQPKVIHQQLREQLISLYGKRIVNLPPVQAQNGSKDCGCFAIAYTISLLYGDDPAQQTYTQKAMRPHLIDCFENNYLTPFPAQQKRAKRSTTSLQIQL